MKPVDITSRETIDIDCLDPKIPDEFLKAASEFRKALRFFTLGRAGLLKSKLYAYCDRGDDFNDCIALKPTLEEIDEAYPWVSFQDGNTNWPEHVMGQFNRLKKALGHV